MSTLTYGTPNEKPQESLSACPTCCLQQAPQLAGMQLLSYNLEHELKFSVPERKFHKARCVDQYTARRLDADSVPSTGAPLIHPNKSNHSLQPPFPCDCRRSTPGCAHPLPVSSYATRVQQLWKCQPIRWPTHLCTLWHFNSLRTKKGGDTGQPCKCFPVCPAAMPLSLTHTPGTQGKAPGWVLWRKQPPCHTSPYQLPAHSDHCSCWPTSATP